MRTAADPQCGASPCGKLLQWNPHCNIAVLGRFLQVPIVGSTTGFSISFSVEVSFLHACLLQLKQWLTNHAYAHPTNDHARLQHNTPTTVPCYKHPQVAQNSWFLNILYCYAPCTCLLMLPRQASLAVVLLPAHCHSAASPALCWAATYRAGGDAWPPQLAGSVGMRDGGQAPVEGEVCSDSSSSSTVAYVVAGAGGLAGATQGLTSSVRIQRSLVVHTYSNS
jgi:hypothetical protein